MAEEKEKNIEQKIPVLIDDDSLEEVMKKDLRGWANALIIIGILSIFMSGLLSPTWGIILIVLGIFTYFALEPALYIVFGLVIIFLGIINSFSGNIGFSVFAVIQILIGMFVLKGYPRYKILYDSVEKKSYKFFALSTLMIILSGGVVITCVVTFITGLIKENSFIQSLFETIWYLSLLGTSFGVASFMTERTIPKILSFIPLCLNIIVFLSFIALAVLGLSG